MKKLIYFFMLIIPLLSVVSCNDDDGISPEHASKVYRAESLNLTFNGQKFTDRRVEFITTDFKTADITIFNTIPNEDSLIIKGVSLLYDGNNIYEFEANNTSAFRDINIKGKIDIKKSLNLDITYKTTSNLIGSWTPDVNWAFDFPYPVEFIIESDNPNDSINFNGFWGWKEKVSYEEFNDRIGAIFNMTFALALKLTVDFHKDGQISSEWKLQPNASFPIPDGQTKPWMALYNLDENYLYTALAVDSIIMDATKPKSNNAIKASNEMPNNGDLLAIVKLLQKMYNGNTPLKYSLTDGNNKLDLWADREMMNPYFESIIKVIAPALRNVDLGKESEEMGASGPLLADLAEELGRAFHNSKKFEIHFKFNRTTENVKSKSKTSPLSKTEIIERFKSIHKTNNRK